MHFEVISITALAGVCIHLFAAEWTRWHKAIVPSMTLGPHLQCPVAGRLRVVS